MYSHGVFDAGISYTLLLNPRRMRAARVTVVVLCVCMYVCMYVYVFALICHLTHGITKNEIPMDSSQYRNQTRSLPI